MTQRLSLIHILKKRQTARQEAFSFLSDKVQESISGIRVLKAFVQEKKDLEEFQKANENNMEKNLAVVKLRSLFGPLLDLITGISLLLTLIIGGKMVINGTVSVGQFVAFNSYIGMLVWPMIACGDCINTFSQASACLLYTSHEIHGFDKNNQNESRRILR